MRKILFRGFHPDNNGTTTIMLNGEQYKGLWIKGNCIHKYYYDFEEDTFVDEWYIHPTDYKNPYTFLVIPETIGQWVGLDKNKNDVFEGDRFLDADETEHTVEFEIFIYWRTECVYMSEDIEVIGNIWEV